MAVRGEVQTLLEQAAADQEALLAQLPDGLRASLPVDATGVTRAIAHLAEAVDVADEVAAEQARLHRANPAVLHGRVFGREPLSPETVLGAFVEGARVRAVLLARVAEAVDGLGLRREVEALLADHPLPEHPGATGALRAAYAAQEQAALLCAERLDAIRR